MRHATVELTRNPFIQPMVPNIVDVPPSGSDWRHEIKFDGFRVQLHLSAGRGVIYSRNGNDFSKRFASLTDRLQSVPAREAVIDSEIVACDESGQPNFKTLMSAGRNATNLCCWCFDLLSLNGKDLRPSPLHVRRLMLRNLLIGADDQGLQYSLDFDDGERLLARADAMGLEGIVSKHQNSPYRSGKTSDWLKTKTPSWRAANVKRGEMFKTRT